IDSQWFLNKVVIRSEDQPYQPVAFICDMTIYYVKINTGDVLQAETHADVHLQIFGEKTQTDYIQLNTINYSINTFQRGSIDMFTIQYHDLGKVYYLFS
ncbi:unnamed protein product, partial [Rotaria sp. Silwood1]